jgi:hypothetical protein
MLFIDFETPHRVRLHGTATIDTHDPFIKEVPGAELVVRVEVDEVFNNCPRYIHKYQRVQTSKYAAQVATNDPVTPQWKRIDEIQDALPEREKDIAKNLGGTITREEYLALRGKGEG